MGDTWVSAAAYESYVGRWSRLVAADFLDWLDPATDLRWLDVGCGPGALTEAILLRCDPHSVLGVDRSEPFVAWAATQVADRRARFAVSDAIRLQEDVADVVVSGLMLNHVADPAAALAAMRAAAPAGLVAAYVWDYAGRMDLMRLFWGAAVAIDPAAATLAEANRFPICQPAALEAVWRDAGLTDVASTAIDVPTRFDDFDDYWTPFLGGTGPAPAYVMSRTRSDRDALRERVRAELPIAADGSIALVARAWAVRGQSPPEGSTSAGERTAQARFSRTRPGPAA